MSSFSEAKLLCICQVAPVLGSRLAMTVDSCPKNCQCKASMGMDTSKALLFTFPYAGGCLSGCSQGALSSSPVLPPQVSVSCTLAWKNSSILPRALTSKISTWISYLWFFSAEDSQASLLSHIENLLSSYFFI